MSQRRPDPEQPAPERRAERRAARMARWYPRGWRERYREEFVALLVDDLLERPIAPSRFVDIVVHGTGARLEAAGLTGEALAPERRLSASLAVVGVALAVFFAR